MKKEPDNPVQILYTAAQLVADDKDEAARLVDRVFTDPQPSSSEEALERLATLAKGMSANRTGILADHLAQEHLDRVVQHALAMLPAERRLDVFRAYLHTDADSPERTVFLYAVQLGMDNPPHKAITVTHVAESLKRSISVISDNVPADLQDVVRARMDSAQRRDGVHVRQTSRRAAVRFATAVAVIVVASFLGMWLGRPAPVPDLPAQNGEDLLVLLEDRLDEDGPPIFAGGSIAQVERLLEERFSMAATVPSMDDGSLQQLWGTEVGGVDIPALTYQGSDDNTVHMFILSYSLIDANRRVLPFPTDVLNQIAAPDGVDIQTGAVWNRVAWRHRDDIYIAFTQDNPVLLRPRISY